MLNDAMEKTSLANDDQQSITAVSVAEFHTAVIDDKQRLQEALLRLRDRATRLSVEILQLQNIPFEN